MMIRFFSLALSVTLLASCAGTANMKTAEPLMANEGIVVTNCKTPHAIARYVNIFPENYKQKFGTSVPSVKCTQDGVLAVIKLDAGDYHAGYALNESMVKYLPKFKVQPKKVNYIGDLRIAVRETNVVTGLLAGFEQPKINVSALDNRQETIQRLKDERPDIAGKYEIVTDIVN